MPLSVREESRNWKHSEIVPASREVGTRTPFKDPSFKDHFGKTPHVASGSCFTGWYLYLAVQTLI